MTDECISPLRRRMIEDMTVRNFVAKSRARKTIPPADAGKTSRCACSRSIAVLRSA